jgi:hypothetical protein
MSTKDSSKTGNNYMDHLNEVMSKTAELRTFKDNNTLNKDKVEYNSPLSKTPPAEGGSIARDIAAMNKLFDVGDKIKYKSEGVKENKGKLFHELDFDFIKQMSERMNSNKTNGKYPRFNWKKDMDEVELRMAIFRHVLEIMEGRYSDDGRPFGHLEALATNAMMLNYQLKKD